MKKAVIAVGIMIVMLLPVQFIIAQVENNDPKEPTNESIESFYNLINGINWKNFKWQDLEDSKKLCFKEFKQRYDKLPKHQLDAANKNSWFLGMGKIVSVQNFINRGGLSDISVKNNAAFPNLVRDHVFNYLKIESDMNEFKKKVKGNGTLTSFDDQMLGFIFKEYKYNMSNIYHAKKTIDGCEVIENWIMNVLDHNTGNGTIKWELRRSVSIKCDCFNAKSSMELDYGFLNQRVTFNSSYVKNGVYDIRFSDPTEAEVTRLSIRCCPNPDADGDGGQMDNGDQGSVPGSNSSSQNCCDTRTTNFSVGLFPAVFVGNNFEDTGVGLGLEGYLPIADTFGDSELYAGAQCQYSTQSSQDGEVTQNTFSAGVLLENRTPILPCTQFTMGVSADYATGTIEAFNNKDDLSGLTFGLHTGFNLDVSEKVAIAINANLLTFGKTTFTPENGPEIDQDVGELSLGRKQARIGIRFKF